MTCTKKVNYGSKKFALEDMALINARKNIKMKLKSAYYCVECRCWHLTKKAENEIY